MGPGIQTKSLFRLALPILLATATLAGCGVSFFGTLAAPSGFTASTDRTDLIELTWEEVNGADVYYVYRSLSPDGPFRAEGPGVSVPYRAVTQPTLLDIDVDPTSYFYTVSSGRLATNDESALTEVREGVLLAEEIGWRDQATVFGAPGTLRLAVDRSSPTIEAYLLTVGNGTAATATVRRIENDGTLTNLGGPSEPTDGTDPRVADLAAAGSVYVAAVAEDPDIVADTDKVFLYRYDELLEEWTAIAPPTIHTPGHPSAPFVTLVALGADDLLLSYRGSAGEMVAYRYDGTWESLTPPSAADDAVDSGPDSIGLIDAAAIPGAAVLLYELEDDTSATLGDTITLRASVWTAGAWTADPAPLYDGSTGNVPDQGAAVTIDPTVSPPTSGISVVYRDDAALHMVNQSGTVVPGSDTGFSGSVDILGSSVGITAQSGLISLFYLDLGEAGGAIARFDTVGSAWSQFSPPDFTQSATPTALVMASGGGKWFAAYDDDGITRVRSYQ